MLICLCFLCPLLLLNTLVVSRGHSQQEQAWERAGHSAPIARVLPLQAGSLVLSVSTNSRERFIVHDPSSEDVLGIWSGLPDEALFHPHLGYLESLTYSHFISAATAPTAPLVSTGYSVDKESFEFKTGSSGKWTDHKLILWDYKQNKFRESHFPASLVEMRFATDDLLYVSTREKIWAVDVRTLNQTEVLQGERLATTLADSLLVTYAPDGIRFYSLPGHVHQYTIPASVAGFTLATVIDGKQQIAFADSLSLRVLDLTTRQFLEVDHPEPIISLAYNAQSALLMVLRASGILSTRRMPENIELATVKIADGRVIERDEDDGFIVGTGTGAMVRYKGYMMDTIARQMPYSEYEASATLVDDKLHLMFGAVHRVINSYGETIAEERFPSWGKISPRAKYVVEWDETDREILIYNLATHALVMRYGLSTRRYLTPIAFNNDESYLAVSGDGDSTIYLLNTLAGSVTSFKDPLLKEGFLSACFVGDDSMMIADRYHLMFLNIPLATLSIVDSNRGGVGAMTYSRALNTLAIARKAKVYLFNLGTDELTTVEPFEFDDVWILSMRFTSDGSGLITSKGDEIGVVHLPNLNYRKLYRSEHLYPRVLGQFRDGGLVTGWNTLVKWNPTKVLSVGNPKDTRVDIAIYPNPASQYLHVAGIPPNTELRVIDPIGRSYAVEARQGVIDVSRLSPGSYFVAFEAEGAAHSFRFIKQ